MQSRIEEVLRWEGFVEKVGFEPGVNCERVHEGGVMAVVMHDRDELVTSE